MTDDELKERIAAVPYWYHAIPIREGITTPGWAPNNGSMYRVPEDMDGKRVLDIGSWDGFWSFLALDRGASYVLAIDDFSDTVGSMTNADRSQAWHTFDLCRDAFGHKYDKCQRVEMSVYDIKEWEFEKFDHVFCFGVLYHLRHPLLALEKLRSVCNGTIHIETAILDNCCSHYTGEVYTGNECCAEFYPHAEYGRNASNWTVGTLKYWAALVESAGFTDVKSWKLTDEPTHVSECRGFISAKVA